MPNCPIVVRSADFVACHQFAFLQKLEVVELARPGGLFLLNAPYGPEEVWDRLPREVQVAFWDGIREGLCVEEAAVRAGASGGAGWRWMRPGAGCGSMAWRIWKSPCARSVVFMRSAGICGDYAGIG